MSPESKKVLLLDRLFVLGFIVTLFFLFTGGLPLAQIGVLPYLSTKGRCVNAMRIAVILFSLTLLGTYLKSPALFKELPFICFFRNLSSKSLIALSVILFLIYADLLTVASFARYAALETRAFDLGIFSQAVWNTTRGDFLYSSLKDGICLLGDHFSPILALLAPVYKIFPDPRTLLTVQAFVSAGSLFCVSHLAYRKTGSPFIALVFTAAYFFYRPTRMALHEDFHPEMLIEPFIFLAFHFLELKKFIPFLLTLAVIASAKENMLGICFVFGVYAFLFAKWRGTGATVSILAVGLFWLLVHNLIPHLSGKPYLYQGFYVYLFQSPGKLFGLLFGTETWEYIFKLFSPFIFLPFFHFPTLMLTFPILAQNILSENPVFRSLSYHYTAALNACLFISAIFGFAQVTAKFSWLKNNKSLFACIFLCVSLVLSGPSEYFLISQSARNITPEKNSLWEGIRQIPAEASVLTHNNMIPPLSNRKFIYQFDHNGTPTKRNLAEELKVDYVVLASNFMEPGTLSWQGTLNDFRGSSYVPVHQSNFLVILKRGETGA